MTAFIVKAVRPGQQVTPSSSGIWGLRSSDVSPSISGSPFLTLPAPDAAPLFNPATSATMGQSEGGKARTNPFASTISNEARVGRQLAVAPDSVRTVAESSSRHNSGGKVTICCMFVFVPTRTCTLLEPLPVGPL